ncbi:aminotransferase class I/II-fold pyridoxal phosphate-dependent enzyme, partial [Myxococcota bacterium]|nr:aminotransferase class I/II-fold pyridoxal phosphate-dependent enzyme [Myxococcota bacterium]
MKDTTIYPFDELIDRRDTNSIKWDFPTRFFPGAPANALPFWVADMDFPVAKPILDAMRERLSDPTFGYTVHQTPRYVQAVMQYYRERFSWEFQPEEILFSPGIVKALALAIRAFTKPGDGVLIQRPVYRPFFTIVEQNGREVVNNALVRTGATYTIDFDDFEAKVSLESTKLFLL